MSGSTAAVMSEPLFDDDHAAFRESVRTFLAREAAPAYGRWRADGSIPREILRAAAEHGYLAMQVPEEHGGAGVDDLRFRVVVAEEAMRAGLPALALVMTTHTDVVVQALGGHDELLAGCASGELVGAVVRGDVALEDQQLHGTAQLVVAGRDADILLVVAGEHVVLVEPGAAGLTIEKSDPPIGLEAAGFADLGFDGVSGAAVGVATKLGIDQWLSLAVSALAGADTALEITTAYVQERKAFGAPIASFQNTRHVLAEVATDLDAAGAFVESCVRERLAGRLTARRAAAVKLHCSELYGRAVDAGLQLHGGYGYIMEYPIAHAYADARFWRLHGATSEQMKDLIATAMFDGS